MREPAYLASRSLAAALPRSALATTSAARSTPPDAALIDLGARLAEAAELRSDLSLRCDDIYERLFQAPPMPEVLLWCRGDRDHVWADIRELEGIEVEGQPRHTYDTDCVVENLDEKIAEWKAVAPASRLPGIDAAIARAQDILSALKVYKAEEAKAFAACGYTAVMDAYERQNAIIADLVQRIATTEARTPEGVCVKARAATDASILSGATLAQILFDRLLKKTDGTARDTEQLLMLSAMLDAAKLRDAKLEAAA